jgi:hypothetical protein
MFALLKLASPHIVDSPSYLLFSRCVRTMNIRADRGRCAESSPVAVRGGIAIVIVAAVPVRRSWKVDCRVEHSTQCLNVVEDVFGKEFVDIPPLLRFL